MTAMNWTTFFLDILKILAFPTAMVLIVAIPWRQFTRWVAVNQRQAEVLIEGMEAILASKVSLETTPLAGAALLQGLARNKEATREKTDVQTQETIKELQKPKAGVRIIQKVIP
jgi:hypothetical protein